jgi:uncharacterized protein YdhG (YjbR/CyaY superfamily)
MVTPKSVDEYMESFPEEIRKRLKQVRALVIKAVPKAEEGISYGMPAYKLNGILVYFAGYKNHIGFYPMPSTLENFKKEITEYKSAKGSVQFPHDKPLPTTLISHMIKFRAAENKMKAAAKKK